MVVLGDVRCAAMQAGAALRSVAASAAAPPGRREGISSGCGLAAGGWWGPAATWRPSRQIRSAVVGGGGARLRSLPSGFGSDGLLLCVRACASAVAGGNRRVCCIRRPVGLGLGFRGCVQGVCVGHLAGQGLPLSMGLFTVGVCGLPGVGGGEAPSGGGSVAGVCG